MYIRMFVAPFLFIMLLCSQILLLPNQVLARCCYCGQCWMQQVYGSQYCYCGGDCPICWTDGFDALQFHTSTDNRPADTTIPQDLTSTIAKAHVTERVMDLMSAGDCFRSKVALSLLGNARDDLKFTLVRFDEKNLLAFQMEVDKEK